MSITREQAEWLIRNSQGPAKQAALDGALSEECALDIVQKAAGSLSEELRLLIKVAHDEAVIVEFARQAFARKTPLDWNNCDGGGAEFWNNEWPGDWDDDAAPGTFEEWLDLYRMSRDGPADELTSWLERQEFQPPTAHADPPAQLAPVVYGTSAVKRIRATNSALAELDDAIIAYAAQQNPITVRGLFYAMMVQGRVTKDVGGYRKVQRRVLDLRRSGALPWDHVSDSTRWARNRAHLHGNMRELLTEVQQLYTRDLWRRQDVAVEVWCEKDALAGVLLEATTKWHVDLMVSRGFSSDTFCYNTAQNIRARGKPTHVYLFTDFDAAGAGIDATIRKKLRAYSDNAEIHFHRAALTLEQIEEWNLPTRPPKKKDVADGYKVCCELDAIPPKQLIQIAEECIVQHIDERELEQTLKNQAEECEMLERWMETFPIVA